jgi:tryptophanyl-tRNA synthetase
VIVFRPEERLHVGNALLLTAPLARLSADRYPRTVLFMDFGHGGPRHGASGLTDACIDRLACLPADAPFRIALATAVPSIARLAAVVASTLRPEEQEAVADSRAWFREILLAAGLLATRATHAVVEAGGESEEAEGPIPVGPQVLLRRRADRAANDLMLARHLVSRIERVLPGACPFPSPLLPGFSPFRSLDGSGPMGSSSRGTLYLSDPPEAIAKKIRTAKTDPRSCFDPAQEVSPEVCNLFLLLHALTGQPAVSLVERFTGKGYSFLKAELVEATDAFLGPIRRRRAELLADDAALAAGIRRESAVLDAAGARVADALSRAPEILAA